MDNLEIKVIDDLDPDLYQIIQEYWKIESGVFVNRPTDLIKKYNLTLQDLNKIIRENSLCKVKMGDCVDCEVEITEDVVSQTGYKSNTRRSPDRCRDCEKQYWKNFQEEAKLEHELAQKGRQERFDFAIENKKWLELDNEEFDILKGIIKYRIKSEIYKNVFLGDPWDKPIWRKVDKIESMGLIEVLRGLDDKSVNGFDFDPRMVVLIDAERQVQTLPYLSFMLSVNGRKTEVRQPNYSGTFTLPDDVHLKAGVKYIYGGWVNTDGSINLKFQPESDIKKYAEQTTLDTEPDHIKKIIGKMIDPDLENSKDEFPD